MSISGPCVTTLICIAFSFSQSASFLLSEMPSQKRINDLPNANLSSNLSKISSSIALRLNRQVCNRVVIPVPSKLQGVPAPSSPTCRQRNCGGTRRAQPQARNARPVPPVYSTKKKPDENTAAAVMPSNSWRSSVVEVDSTQNRAFWSWKCETAPRY